MLSTSRLAFALIGVLSLAWGPGCARSVRRAQPVASLSTTPQAAAELAPLREAWAARKLERASVEAFLARYPEDGAAPLAKVYLAFVLIEEGQLVAADGVLATVTDLPPGSTRDLATIGRARSLRLHGAPRSALDALRPLVGKVVDDADREVFLEEIALAAIAARDDYEALAYLDAWLRGVGEDEKDRARERIEALLVTLPREVLEQTYRSIRERGAISGYGSDTQKLISERLARIAVESNDAALARWLVDVSGVSAARAGGEAGFELGELAASRRGLATVTGRTLGLLLPARDLRDEAADVVRGVSWALDLPRRSATEGGVRLVTRDDGIEPAETRGALEELAGEGATVIIAGFDHGSAERALLWSEETGVPVLSLAAPSASSAPRRVAVVLGERAEREASVLAEALARHGVGTAASVVPGPGDAASGPVGEAGGLVLLPPVGCDAPLASPDGARFPVEAWWRSGARGWLVSGPSSCARDLLRELGGISRRSAAATLAVALTLEAGVPRYDVPKNVTVLSAAAGIVPILSTDPKDVADEDVRAFMERFGARPSYWTALGRDAGALAKAALAPLPTDTTSDPNAVVQRRAIVQAGLVATRVRLWTSEERGVGADRALARRVGVVSWSGGE